MMMMKRMMMMMMDPPYRDTCRATSYVSYIAAHRRNRRNGPNECIYGVHSDDRIGRIYSTKKKEPCHSGSYFGAVRPVPIRIMTVSSKKTSQSCVEEWTKKVSRYTQVETITMKPNPLNASDTSVAVREEGKRICQKLKQQSGGSYVVCLDERGRDATSESFADIVARVSENGYSSLTCVIGGPFGLDQSVRDMADETVCLSKCVLNHSVAHIVLMEQLYRAWTIVKGEPYHH
jgi:23S rRNA (pseudouridine1915-N3)-methyltransferase